ncbi:MAG: hypothetical protein HZA22_14105 [Nitrospirae bacterium]|nr:hypothetical protein [Nitrospirota bacterium]MBI5696052.1 hypothetical protein [Nitrospirota bacterium]
MRLRRNVNALDPKARSLPTYPHHKHVGEKMVGSHPPTLKQVLEEVETYF